nr:MAG TPA: hypothetical protein [Caudoviricetes sp.]
MSSKLVLTKLIEVVFQDILKRISLKLHLSTTHCR